MVFQLYIYLGNVVTIDITFVQIAEYLTLAWVTLKLNVLVSI